MDPKAQQTILLVDSDDRFRRLIVSAAEQYGPRIIQATSLSEADLELPFSKANLVILDCQMKDGDGIAWLQKKRQAGFDATVFVITNGCHQTCDYTKLKNELGVKVFFHKPVSPYILGEILKDHFQVDPGAAGGPGRPADGPDLDEIEREIKALSIEYMRELPERFEFLKRQVQDLKLGRGEASTAKNEAHKIKGTASSYGAHDIGKLAVVIDDCLRKVDGDRSACDAAFWKSLEDAIEEALRLSQDSVAQSNSAAAVPAVYNERDALASMGLSCARGHNIVIVDDDPDFTKRVSLVLGYEDMLVYSFNDAKELPTILADLRPDLLILDLNMPDVDGFEVCKRIRVDSRWRNLPIVFLTAQTGWETRVAAFDAGADDYIPKPVVNQELIARIRFRADKSRLQEQVQNQTTINQLLWRAMYILLVQSQAASREEGLSSSGKSG